MTLNRWRNNTKSLFHSIKTCITISWKASSVYTIVRIGCNLLLPITSLLAAFCGKYMLDLLAGNWERGQKNLCLWMLSIGILLAGVIRILANKALSFYQAIHNDIINKDLAVYLMDKAGSVDIEQFDDKKYYDTLNASVRDAPMITYLLWNTMSAISALVTVMISIITLSYFNWLYCVLIVIATIPSLVVSAKYTEEIYAISIKQITGERKKNYLQSIIMERNFSQEVRLFMLRDVINNKYKKIWNDLYFEKKGVLWKRGVYTGILECLPELIVAIISIDIAFGVLSGNATVGDYSLYSGLVLQLWSGLLTCLTNLVQIYDNHLKITNVSRVGQIESRVADNGTRKLKQINTIEFENVTFSYPGTRKRTLYNVSFIINKNEKVGFVGQNGSGKTTIIKLLLRFYDVEQGKIKINGLDIKEYSIKDLRKNFSVYFQNEASFAFSLRENVTISDVERIANDEEILQILEKNGADRVLSRADNGLNTYVSRAFDDQGIELSGGEYQSLALARTLYRSHTALFLDEPSSNLDPQAESIFFDNLKTSSHGRIVLFTSHRVSNMLAADRIIMLEKGQVVESGTHQFLLSANGKYAKQFRQMQETIMEKNNADCNN